MSDDGYFIYVYPGANIEDATFVPGRPPFELRAKDLAIRIATGPGAGAWEFGEGDELGSPLYMTAYDMSGNVVETSAELLFPGPVDGSDPEYENLIRYVNVAVNECVRLAADLPDMFEVATTTINGVVLQRPEVRDAAHALDFPFEQLRVWAASENGHWNGYTLFGTAVQDEILTTAQVETLAPLLPTFLRRSALHEALESALSAFPDAKTLLEKIETAIGEET